MSREITKKDTDMSKDDQEKINKFSRLYRRAKELRADLELKAKFIETLDDSKLLIEEAMGDPVKVMIGESFVESDEDFANAFVERRVEETKKEIATMEKELEGYNKDIVALKSHLYAKFGENINLDE